MAVTLPFVPILRDIDVLESENPSITVIVIVSTCPFHVTVTSAVPVLFAVNIPVLESYETILLLLDA